MSTWEGGASAGAAAVGRGSWGPRGQKSPSVGCWHPPGLFIQVSRGRVWLGEGVPEGVGVPLGVTLGVLLEVPEGEAVPVPEGVMDALTVPVVLPL